MKSLKCYAADFAYGCRATRGLQGALGDLCRPDPVRDQQEEHYRLGNHACILVQKKYL